MVEPNIIYDWKNEKKPICCLCECAEGVHLLYWGCPIFGGEMICNECCQLESLKEDIAKKFSEKLGTPLTLDEVNEQCRKCGKNYGKQNPYLAIQMDMGKGIQGDSNEQPTEETK